MRTRDTAARELLREFHRQATGSNSFGRGLPVIYNPVKFRASPTPRMQDDISCTWIAILGFSHAASIHKKRTTNSFLIWNMGVTKEQHLRSGELRQPLKAGLWTIFDQVLIHPPRAAVN